MTFRLSPQASRRIVQASAWYDIFVSLPLATPWTLGLMLGAIQQVHSQLHMSGIVSEQTAGLTFFANLMGTIVVIWSIARIMNPAVWMGRLDAVSRVVFISWMLYAVAHGLTSLLIGFAAVEVVWLVLQVLPVRKI